LPADLSWEAADRPQAGPLLVRCGGIELRLGTGMRLTRRRNIRGGIAHFRPIVGVLGPATLRFRVESGVQVTNT